MITTNIMKNRIVKALIMLTCMTSCTHNHNGDYNYTEEYINLNKVTDAITNDVVDSISYLGLSDINGNIPVNVNKLYVVNGTIYIGDCWHSKVFAYDRKSGVPKFVLDSRGSGPEEYLEIRSIAIDTAAIYIVDNYTQRMMVYDSNDGSYIRTMKIPVIADDVETLDDGGFIFAYIPMKGVKLAIDQPESRLFIVDKDLKIRDSYQEVKDGIYDAIGQRTIFSRCDQGIVFSTASIDGFFIIDPKDPSKQTLIRLPFTNGLEGKRDVVPDEISGYQHLSSVPYVCGDNIYISYTSDKGHDESVLWNSRYNGILQNSSDDLSKALIPIVGTDNGCLIGMVDDYETYSYMIEQGFAKAPDNVSQLLKDGSGIALVFYKMKK